MNWIAWSFGLFLIGIMLIVSGYMFVVYLKSQHKKNQEDEQRRIEEQKSFKDQLARNNQSGLSSAESVKEEGVSEKQVETEYPESSRIEEPSVKPPPPPTGNVCVAPPIVNSNPSKPSNPAPKQGSKEPSTEELSSKKSLTDLKPIVSSKPAEKNDGETSVEIVPNAQIPIPPVEKRVVLSAEKAPGSSIGSDISTYVISSQRSEVNNYNQLEAGRTPPTFSNTENIFHRTSSIESLAPSTAAPSSVGTVVPLAKQNSETIVSLPTPPLKK
ncbi:hypothetical protein CAEBREN_20764 [Caenorhabditis brenneri]|uniref:Uncharacterized protein n=1 Tax=Caenorhabditis brenneri TaxID=135651 RepID=G0MDZ9_CAEBE|nr:hypothetical protein CAEBREN_20764 [Caenorhabditis brenneri]